MFVSGGFLLAVVLVFTQAVPVPVPADGMIINPGIYIRVYTYIAILSVFFSFKNSIANNIKHEFFFTFVFNKSN